VDWIISHTSVRSSILCINLRSRQAKQNSHLHRCGFDYCLGTCSYSPLMCKLCEEVKTRLHGKTHVIYYTRIELLKR